GDVLPGGAEVLPSRADRGLVAALQLVESVAEEGHHGHEPAEAGRGEPGQRVERRPEQAHGCTRHAEPRRDPTVAAHGLVRRLQVDDQRSGVGVGHQEYSWFRLVALVSSTDW